MDALSGRVRRATCVAFALAALCSPSATAGGERPDDVIPLAAWQAPPRDARPIARWWWPGGGVEQQAVDDQLAEIARAGFGGVELQPLLLGIGPDELAADPRLRTVGRPGFREQVARAAKTAARHGLAFDLTLGSGWPGGLPTARENAEQQLLMATLDVEGPEPVDVALPPVPDQSYRASVEWVLDVLGPRRTEAALRAVVAARVGPERDGIETLEAAHTITDAARSGRLRWTPPEGRWRVFFFYANATGHFVMGGAFPGAESDALVVDHLSKAGADALLTGHAAPLVDAVGGERLRDVFVDSFELMGELPFTHDFLAAFETRAGYDLTPHLPLVFRRGGESKYAAMMDVFGRLGGPAYLSRDPGREARVREDYERVRRALFEEAFIARFVTWAHARGLGLRLQAHGGYGDVLDTYALADVPESEGLYAAGSYDFLKLAASAAHVAGRTWASSESFITLRLLGTGIDDDEMRLLAGRAYSAGINRIVYHGVPAPYALQDGERWFPFPGGFGRILAGPLPMSLDVDPERLAGLHGFNDRLARTSVAMSTGAPATDVAWLHPEPDHPDAASFQLGRVEARGGESAEAAIMRGLGLAHDRVSRRMLTRARVERGALIVGEARHRALLLDPLEVAEPALVERVAEIAEAGIPVVSLGRLPARAPGWHGAAERDRRVEAARARLSARVVRADLQTLRRTLEERVPPSVVGPPEGRALEVSIARRRAPGGDVLFVYNESWARHEAELRFVVAGGPLVRWDARTGARERLRERVSAGDVVSVALGPAEWAILTLGREDAATAATTQLP